LVVGLFVLFYNTFCVFCVSVTLVSHVQSLWLNIETLFAHCYKVTGLEFISLCLTYTCYNRRSTLFVTFDAHEVSMIC